MIISGAYIARMNLVDIRGDTGWHSVAYSRSGTGSGTHRVYHNGMEQDEETDSASNFVQPTTVPLEIGRRNPASQMFHGNVEYIYIWDRILTPQEISWIYREPYAMFSQPRRVSFLVPKYPYADRRYSRGDEEVLPSDDREMETPFVISDYSGVAADDNVYVLQTALGQHGIFRFDNYNINATDPISATCKLKSTLAPSASVVKLQILNRNTPAWEDLDTDNATAADTEFTLEGTQSSNLSYYYGDENRVSFRVYQEAV
jgi:hypothetical protein